MLPESEEKMKIKTEYSKTSKESLDVLLCRMITERINIEAQKLNNTSCVITGDKTTDSGIKIDVDVAATV